MIPTKLDPIPAPALVIIDPGRLAVVELAQRLTLAPIGPLPASRISYRSEAYC